MSILLGKALSGENQRIRVHSANPFFFNSGLIFHSICVHVCIKCSLSVHLLADICVVSLPWLLGIMLQGTQECNTSWRC